MRLGLRLVLAVVVACSQSAQLGAQTSVPSAPVNFTGSALGGTITLAWGVPLTGAPIHYYVLDLGLQSGTYDVSVPVGPITTLSFDVDDGVYYFRVRAANALGPGAPTAAVAVVVGGATQVPSPPQQVTATAVGPALTINWAEPAIGAPITDYFLQFGTASGVYGASGRTGLVTSVTLPNLPDGVYFFRVSAINAAGLGAPSNEVSVVVGVASQLPTAPQNPYVTYGSSLTTFAWSPPARGAPITDYVIEIGLTPGAYIYARSLGPATSFSLTGTQSTTSGTYYFRVTAVNALGTGPASAEAGIDFGGSRVPSAPQNVIATVTGSALSVTWAAPTFGGAIADYVLEYGITPGVYVGAISVGPVTSFAAPGVADGIYYLRVSARNVNGVGAPSAELRVYVGPPCTIPAPPQLTGSASGNQISLAWTTPPGGPITSYTLFIATSAGGPDSTSGNVGLVNTISGPASGGTLFLRVAANALCGAGPASNRIAVTVP